MTTSTPTTAPDDTRVPLDVDIAEARILYRALTVSALPGAQPLRDKIERAVKKAQGRETMRDWVEAHTGVTAR